MNRRNIIKNGTLASAAVLLPAAGALGANSRSSVVAGLSAYSANVHTVTDGGEIHLLASIDNLKAFVDDGTRQKALPYSNIVAEGNVLSFTHGGTAYKVENVLPQHFKARAKALG